MSTINVNYMTRTYNSFLKGQETRKTSGKSMADTIAEKMSGSGKTGEVTEASRSGEISTKDMTMEEYKQYIRDKISEIPLHPSRSRESISVTISEAGFEAMKNDPEYEAWVLNDMRTGWAQPDVWAGTMGAAYHTTYYGATKEECHVEGWYAGYQNGNGKSIWESRSKDSFWERRIEHKKQIEVQEKKAQQKKRLQHAENEKAAMQKRFEHQRLLADYQKRDMTAGNAASVGSVVTSQMAIASYEANFVTTGGMI